MQLFIRDDPSAAAMFDTAMHQQTVDAGAEKDATQQSKDIAALGNMVGLFTTAKNDIRYSAAQQLDEQHEFNLTLVNTAGVLLSGTSLPKGVQNKFATKGFKYTQTLATWGRSVKAPTTDPFSTNNAATVDEINSHNSEEVVNSYTPAIAEGLIRSGAMPVPAGRSWYDPKTGKVLPQAWDDHDFTGWFGKNYPYPATSGPAASFSFGYNKYEVQYRGH